MNSFDKWTESRDVQNCWVTWSTLLIDFRLVSIKIYLRFTIGKTEFFSIVLNIYSFYNPKTGVKHSDCSSVLTIPKTSKPTIKYINMEAFSLEEINDFINDFDTRHVIFSKMYWLLSRDMKFPPNSEWISFYIYIVWFPICVP